MFESRGDLNRCTPCRGKLDQHDTYACNTSPRTPSVHFLLAIPVHGKLSRDVDRFEQITLLLRKSAPDIIYSMSADRSAGPYPVSLKLTNCDVSALKKDG
jgi:hypothetical protein